MTSLARGFRYTSVGEKTCHHGWSPGSFGYYQQDADLFASWEVDYVKMDWCGGVSTQISSPGFLLVLTGCVHRTKPRLATRTSPRR